MQGTNVFRDKVSVEQDIEQHAVDDGPELRPTVKLETQAKVDSEAIEKVAGVDERDHPYGMTLEAQEKWEAREWEKRRTREHRQRSEPTNREAANRAVAAKGSAQRRTRFEERAASVDPSLDPHAPDPREELSREEVAAVNQQAQRITEGVRESSTRAAVARQLAERVVQGDDVLSASVAVLEAERARPGTVVPIGDLEDVPRSEVSVQGVVTELWEPSHPAISQVGLLKDDTGRTKWTAWKRSEVTPVREGEQVRFRAAAKNWYQGRCSIALTGDSRVVRP
jgi:hypothetical protein